MTKNIVSKSWNFTGPSRASYSSNNLDGSSEVNEAAIFIAPGGVDSPGRSGIGEPYATINYAMANNLSEKEFIARGGTYNNDYTTENGVNGLHLQGSGTDANNRYILQGFPGETAIIDQGGLANGPCAYSKQWLKIHNLTIRNTYDGSGNDDAGGVFLNGSSEAEITSNHIHNCDGNTGSNVGAVRTDTSFNVLIEDNLLHDVTVGGIANGNAACVHGFGQYNITVRQNTMYNANRGLYHKDSAGRDTGTFGYLMERNIIRNVDDGCYYDLAGGGGLPHNNQYVRQNLFYEIALNAVHLDASDAATNNKLIELTNNVLDCNGTTENMWWLTDVDSVINYNNIMLNALVKDAQRYEDGNGGSYVITESNYNRYHSTVRFILDLFDPEQQIFNTLAAWQGQGYDANSTQSDPLFVNAAARDYHLQGGSPLIGTGKNGQNFGLYLTGTEQIGSTLGG